MRSSYKSSTTIKVLFIAVILSVVSTGLYGLDHLLKADPEKYAKTFLVTEYDCPASKVTVKEQSRMDDYYYYNVTVCGTKGRLKCRRDVRYGSISCQIIDKRKNHRKMNDQ